MSRFAKDNNANPYVIWCVQCMLDDGCCPVEPHFASCMTAHHMLRFLQRLLQLLSMPYIHWVPPLLATDHAKHGQPQHGPTTVGCLLHLSCSRPELGTQLPLLYTSLIWSLLHWLCCDQHPTGNMWDCFKTWTHNGFGHFVLTYWYQNMNWFNRIHVNISDNFQDQLVKSNLSFNAIQKCESMMSIVYRQ